MTITKEKILASLNELGDKLVCTQTRLCLPIIERICRKMQAGLRFPNIKIYENIICDGHHRYIASLLSGHQVNRVSYPPTSATEIVNWEDVEYITEDYENPSEITALDKKDADFNEITLEELNHLLSKMQHF